jgi:hypothetical protein
VRFEYRPGALASPANTFDQRVCISSFEMSRHLSKKCVIQSSSMFLWARPVFKKRQSLTGDCLDVVLSFRFLNEEASDRTILKSGDLDLRNCPDLLGFSLGFSNSTDLVRLKNPPIASDIFSISTVAGLESSRKLINPPPWPFPVA